MPETYQNPYPGLRAFEFEESHLFFGREGLNEELLRRLCRNHFVAVVGTSGSGKSSLVRAGLLPLLYGGFMPDAGANWRVAVIKPGKNPIRNLAEALACPAELETKQISGNKEHSEDEKLKIAVTETVLRRSAVGLLQYASGSELAPEENLLVVVDQFEEIFRFKEKSKPDGAGEPAIKKPEDEAAAFVKLLIEAATDKVSRVYVVITMRSDFLGDCAQFRDLPETINEGQYLIPRLTREQLRKSIEGPAKVYGAQMTPALVTRVLNDIGEDQDQLPVLQHALMRTWQKWTNDKTPGEPLDIPHYEATGGMAEALSRHANRAYEQLSEEQQIMAGKLFKCLTVIDGENREVRRATELGKICAIITGNNDFSPADLDEAIFVINAFRRPGRTFLMPPPDVPLDKNSLIDISHESLIRKWDKLREWVAAEAKHSHRYRRLAEDAFAESSFWDDPELREALEWNAEFKPNETWAQLYYGFWGQRELANFPETIKFLNDSKQNRDDEIAEKRRSRKALERSARNLRVAVVALLILLLATTGLTIYAFRQKQYADKQKQYADLLLQQNQETSRQLAVTYKQIDDNVVMVNDINQQLNTQKGQIEKAKDTLQITNDQLNLKTQQLEKNKRDLQVAFSQQKEATERAETEKARALLNEKEVEKAYERLEVESEKTETARQLAVEAKEDLEKAVTREELNRKGLISLEKSQIKTALKEFTDLFNAYENDTELKPNIKNEGKWWALHNLGTINWKLQNFTEAENKYNEALVILGEPREVIEEVRIFQPSGFAQYFLQPVSYQSSNSEIDRSKIATLQRLAQLYRERARDSSENRPAAQFNKMAIKRYTRLMNLLRINSDVTEDPLYQAGVEIEFADTNFDLNNNDKAREYYEKALTTFKDNNRQQNLSSIIAAENKLSKLELRENKFEEAEKRVKRIIKIRNEEFGLSPYHADMAEGYDNLADIFYSQNESEKSEKEKQARIEKLAQEQKQGKSRNQASEKDKSQTVTQAIPQATPRAEEKTKSQIKADNYSYLARLIRQWNEIKKIQIRTLYQYEDLARSYAAVGECKKAETVYLGGFKLDHNPGDYKNRLDRILKVAGFYENFLNDDKKAERYYLDLVSEIEKPEFAVYYNSLAELQRQNYYISFYNIARFFNERGKYEQAITAFKRYITLETATRNSSTETEVQQLSFSYRSSAQLFLAEIYETANKTDEAKKMYADALASINSRPKKNVAEEDFYEIASYEIQQAHILTKQADLSPQTDNAKKQKLYEQARATYIKYLTDSGGATNKSEIMSDYSNLNGDYSHLLFGLGEIQRVEKNEGGAVKFYEQAVTASDLYIDYLSKSKAQYADAFTVEDYYTKKLIEAYNKRARILESWASIVAGTNRTLKQKEAQVYREKARQIFPQSKANKKKCDTVE